MGVEMSGIRRWLSQFGCGVVVGASLVGSSWLLETSRRTEATPPRLFAREQAREQPTIAAHFSPHGGCVGEVVSRIAAAEKTIHVRAYGFSSPAIGQALAEAAKRGVEVRIICDRSVRKSKHSQASACRAAGAEVVFDGAHPIAHSKVIVVDGQWCLVGSYNWTKQAEKNSEVLLTIRSRDLAKKLIEDFTFHRAHATR